MSALLPDEHPVGWVTAAPLWPAALAAGADAGTAQRSAMRRPALLRFASDSFMDDLARQLEGDPGGLADHEAAPRSYRVRPPGVAEDWEPDGAQPALKLYQPAHGDFNLVTASLVCQTPGLPDRAVHPEHGDRVTFVVRRLHDRGELAWVPDAASPGGRAWGAVADTALATVADGEELLPLFAATFTAEARRRRLYVGLIPTSSRESYRNAGPASLPAQPDQGHDPRLMVLISKVRDPLQSLKDQLQKEQQNPGGPHVDPEVLSPFIAMELAGFLADNLPGWADILAGAAAQPNQAAWPLYHWTDTHPADVTRSLTWLAAVRGAWSDRLALCGEQGTPTFGLDLSGADTTVVGNVRNAWEAQVPDPVPSPSVPDPAAQPVAKLTPRDDARYVVRCVYQRPQCGPLHDDVVGDPSADFAIASFFDLDAPARTLQISLPIDTSPAGLRKARKNVSLMLSDQLKQQLSRVSDLKKMSDGQLADGEGLDIGLVCSFSIPIITICALFVLVIFISLLNIVFWWLPFFRICLPLGLKARS